MAGVVLNCRDHAIESDPMNDERNMGTELLSMYFGHVADVEPVLSHFAAPRSSSW